MTVDDTVETNFKHSTGILHLKITKIMRIILLANSPMHSKQKFRTTRFRDPKKVTNTSLEVVS